MLSSVDKAIVALIMAIVALINSTTNFHIGLTETQVTVILTVLSPALVWLVPNKTK